MRRVAAEVSRQISKLPDDPGGSAPIGSGEGPR